MTPNVFGLMTGDAAVVALLGAGDACRVFPHGEAPSDVVAPYVTWTIVAGSPENMMSDRPGVDRFIIQFDAWGDTNASAKAAAVAVRDAVESVAYVIAYNPSERDAETQRFRYSFDSEFIVKR